MTGILRFGSEAARRAQDSGPWRARCKCWGGDCNRRNATRASCNVGAAFRNVAATRWARDVWRSGWRGLAGLSSPCEGRQVRGVGCVAAAGEEVAVARRGDGWLLLLLSRPGAFEIPRIDQSLIPQARAWNGSSRRARSGWRERRSRRPPPDAPTRQRGSPLARP